MLQVGGLALLLIGSLVALGTWASDVPAAPPGMVNEVLSFREGAMPYLWGMPNAHGANSQYIQRGAFQRTPKKHKELPPNPVPPPPPSITTADIVSWTPRMRRVYMKAKVNALLDWAEDNGIQISPRVELRMSHLGVSIWAKRDIPTLYDCIVVPLDMIIWKNRTKLHGPFGFYKQWKSPEEPLALYLIYEWTKPDSVFRGWLDMLPPVPDGYHTYSPLWWSGEEVKRELPDFFNVTHSYNLAFNESYETVKRNFVDRLHVIMPQVRLPPDVTFNLTLFRQHFTYERYKWAWLVIQTRRHSCPRRFNASSCVLPIMDMFNHEPGGRPLFSPQIMEPHQNMAVVGTNRAYKAGEELRASYHLSAENSYLLTFYGFALEQNPFDSVYFSLKQYYRNNIIALNSLHRYTSAVFTHQNQPLIALHAARAYAALFSELSPAAIRKLRTFQPFSVVNEYRAITKLLETLNPLTGAHRDKFTYVYHTFAFQASITKERLFRKELDDCIAGRLDKKEILRKEKEGKIKAALREARKVKRELRAKARLMAKAKGKNNTSAEANNSTSKNGDSNHSGEDNGLTEEDEEDEEEDEVLAEAMAAACVPGDASCETKKKMKQASKAEGTYPSFLHPRERFRFASVIREQRDIIQLRVVKWLIARRKYLMTHCTLPSHDDPEHG